MAKTRNLLYRVKNTWLQWFQWLHIIKNVVNKAFIRVYKNIKSGYFMVTQRLQAR